MAITPADIKQLREATGAGMMDSKKALKEANGDMEQAETILRKRGQKIAEKKRSREAKEGLVGTYAHATGKVGAMVEVACETDFVARSEPFQELVHHLTMHVAAANPTYLKPEDVPAKVVEKEREIYRAEAEQSGKPAKVMEKIIEGKLAKLYEVECLLRQPFIMEEKQTVEELLIQKIQQIGEKIEITRFVRYEL